MSRGLPVLTYHALDRSGVPTSTDPARFAATMEALADAGFRAVDPADWVARGRPPMEKGFALTFDDGLASIRLAAPILARHSWMATAFLVAGRMGGSNDWPGQPSWVPRARLLDWSDLADLHAAGFRFGSHGWTHRRLDRLSRLEVEEELRRSRREIEERTGLSCPLLAYPYGLASTRVEAVVRRHYAAAFGTRLDVADADEPSCRLSRIDACYLRRPADVARLIAGRRDGWLRARRTLRALRRAGRRLVGAEG